MCTQPNNDTLHAESLAVGSLVGGSLARKIEKGGERTLTNAAKHSFATRPRLEQQGAEQIISPKFIRYQGPIDRDLIIRTIEIAPF
jgi:hypothetical protein